MAAMTSRRTRQTNSVLALSMNARPDTCASTNTAHLQKVANNSRPKASGAVVLSDNPSKTENMEAQSAGPTADSKRKRARPRLKQGATGLNNLKTLVAERRCLR